MMMKWGGSNRGLNAASWCVREKKRCVGWVEKYFKDCLCNERDGWSFGFGLVSLVAWGVAEVPQIITNFRTKSSHGVSLLFLLTWFFGDIFNLVGCLLEPATLPTQFYTALLYTASTVVLVVQGVYYGHLYMWWKCRHHCATPQLEEEKKPLKATSEAGIPIPSAPLKATPRREFYYMSARSLAGSDTPPFRSYLRVVKSGPSTMGLVDHSSSDDDDNQPTSSPIPIPKPLSRPAAAGAVVAASVNLPIKGAHALAQAYLGFTARKLLHAENEMEHNAIGQWLGWLMAAIYMGGRIPQIVLNIKRGSVEGLNPLMFIFALIANTAYVLSIVVRSTEWEKIKPNLPWLLDAVVCVALDLFIILQYVYYKYLRRRSHNDDNDDNDNDFYVEAAKPILS